MRCTTCGSTAGVDSGDGQWTCLECGDEWPIDDNDPPA